MSVHDHHSFAAARRLHLRPGAMAAAERWRWTLVVVAAMLAALVCGWTGFIASDDSLYYEGATRWLTDPPFAGTNHWETRFPLVLSFAGVIALAGPGFGAFAITAVLFYVLFVAAAGIATGRIAGERAGWIGAILAATLPVAVANATTVSVDLLEASLLLAGITLLGAAEGRGSFGLAAGAAFGLALLCRETTALPLLGLLPVFLLGRPVERRVLIAAGVGFALVVGAEALFQYWVTGDPLRRYAIAFHHDEHIDRARNLEGNLLLWPPIDPLLVLFVNDDFALLFWAAGLALATGTWGTLGAEGRRRFAVLGAMAAASFLAVAMLYTKLVLNPRYFMLPALAAIVLVATMLARGGAWTRGIGLVALVGPALLLLSVSNAHPRWQMEALLAAARAHPGEPVWGDAEEVRRAALPMRFAGVANLREGTAPAGGLMVIPEAMAEGAVLARYPSPPTKLGAVLRTLGVEPLVPALMARRMFAPNPTYVLVRTPG
jgi:4-amino-4-deoxy-L-arabinose transferase-like glycosyltransferase